MKLFGNGWHGVCSSFFAHLSALQNKGLGEDPI